MTPTDRTTPAGEREALEEYERLKLALIDAAYEFGSQTGSGRDQDAAEKALDALVLPILTTRPTPAPAEGGWQPIETAPKDGTFVDLWMLGNFRIPDAAWCGGEWCTMEVQEGGCGWDRLPGRPTHWRPLPQPPKEAP